ncbi:DUF5339 domain-containing protein [Avibacterium paragallinarum]|uniref:DUF5339 domain-containing protein n=1 Tax=Avibacterium paragallinarum TaxID=728 RepID=UPI0021F740E6|nr:DUF5339 domain-containing protein [Avibacterium paragallinarum]UXN35220.1 DUF5339 domain-containing protein [Avibacterium paragallinarum]
MKKFIVVISLLLSACSSVVNPPKLASSCQTYFQILDANVATASLPAEKLQALQQDFSQYHKEFTGLSLEKQEQFCRSRLTRFLQ